MPKTTNTNIPEEVLKEIESLPDTGYQSRHRDYLPWEDEVIIRFYRIKPTMDLCKVLGRSKHALSNRVEALRSKGIKFAYEGE